MDGPLATNAAPPGPAIANGSIAPPVVGEGLPQCAWRVATLREGTYFCRHALVHAQDHLVNSLICRACGPRTLPCPVPRDVPAQPLAITSRPAPIQSPLHYISTEQLVADVREFIGRLPADLSGVAGIPRSGLLPATQIALTLHLPLFELCRTKGLRSIGTGLRMQDALIPAGPLLVVDDSVYGGLALSTARSLLRQFHPEVQAIFAAIYPRPETLAQLDLYARPAPSPHLFEWNLFNCSQTRLFAMDFDGILCQDWPGGDEEGEDYLRFLQRAAPRWLPRRAPVPLIVTARLEKHRAATEAWLLRQGVRWVRLVMGPWESTQQRRELYRAGQHKGEAYAESACTLFIESDERQAQLIFEQARKPVLCPAAGRVFQ